MRPSAPCIRISEYEVLLIGHLEEPSNAQQIQQHKYSKVSRRMLQRLCAVCDAIDPAWIRLSAPQMQTPHIATSVDKVLKPDCFRVRMQTIGGAYVLIDFEHSGRADAQPLFQPLVHWPEECRLPNASYSKAADMFSLGKVMESYPIRLSTTAASLSKRMLHADPVMRPSAHSALLDAWFVAS